jgi:hypothetical protein
MGEPDPHLWSLASDTGTNRVNTKEQRLNGLTTYFGHFPRHLRNGLRQNGRLKQGMFFQEHKTAPNATGRVGAIAYDFSLYHNSPFGVPAFSFASSQVCPQSNCPLPGGVNQSAGFKR